MEARIIRQHEVFRLTKLAAMFVKTVQEQEGFTLSSYKYRTEL